MTIDDLPAIPEVIIRLGARQSTTEANATPGRLPSQVSIAIDHAPPAGWTRPRYAWWEILSHGDRRPKQIRAERLTVNLAVNKPVDAEGRW